MHKLIKIIFTLLPVFLGLQFTVHAQVAAPDPYDAAVKKNFVREWSPTAPIADALVVPTRPVEEVKRTTSYLDGLGRPYQSVALQVSPAKKDMVTAMVYDDYGREKYKYLPFVSTGNDGIFKTDPFQQQVAFMNNQYAGQNETYFYGQQNFEPSPLERPLAQLQPGTSWVGSNRGTTIQYLNNTPDDDVKIWAIADANAAIPTVTGVYAAGTLAKLQTTDEQGNKMVEYKDKLGKVILKKVQLNASPGLSYDGWLCTYYIYDAFENLRLVIQPKAVEAIRSNWVISAAMRDELCFYYSYDERNRMKIKKVPGAAEVYMVYDSRDRLVMSQDGNLRNGSRWMVTVYDGLNRPVQTGLLTDAATSFATHSSNAAGLTNYPSTATGFELLSENYYDDYSWVATSNTSLSATINVTNISNSNYFNTSYNTAPYFALPITVNYSTRGIITGTKEKVLGSGNQFLYTVTFYDEKGRPVQIQSINASSGKDISTIQYDFSGHPLRNLLEHQKNGNNTQTSTVLTKFEYDHTGRLLRVKKTVSCNVGGQNINVSEKTIVQNSYDEPGQLKTKKLGTKPNSNTELETLSYDYNIRGWLLGVNRDFVKDANSASYFGFDLGYDKPATLISGTNYATPQYNGNIEGTIWKSKGDNEKRKYDFGYDNANRLLAADFNQYTGGSFNKTANVDFSVSNLAYDANGNILSMWQKGLKINSSSLIDQLSYNYTAGSNKLLNVIDGVNDVTTRLGDFRASALYQQSVPAKTSTTVDYNYDVNGNLVNDNNKDIKATGANGIIYNHLNLPQMITVAGKGTISYTYDAAGNKLKKIVTDNTVSPAKITSTDYIGGFVYENDVLQFISHDEGRIRFIPSNIGTTNPPFAFDYFIKDHLGNVRVVLTEEQKVDQYPAATMETAQAATEELFYANLPATRSDKPPGYPTDNTTSPNDKVAKTNGNGNKIGPSIILKVMAGDKFNVKVSSWYRTNGATPNTPVNPLPDLLAALINGVSGVSASGGHKVTAAELQGSGALTPGTTNFLNNQTNNTNSSKPQAYLNWILFDEQFNLVSSSSGFEQVGNNEEFKLHVKNDMPVDKCGYLYVYVSNNTPNIDVYFDNLQVTHTRGAMLETNQFYPFGLKMSAISYSAAGSLKNKTKFGGKELQSGEFTDGSGLEWSDFGARMLDPQIGRWVIPDPLSDKALGWTPYRFCFDNPLLYIDPNGKWEFTEKKDDNGKSTLQLKMSDGKKDDLASFKKQSGLSDPKIEKLFGGKEAMNKFFTSGEKSIDVSKLGGKLGKMLQGMEKALNQGNVELTKAAADKEHSGLGINNCFNTTKNATTSGNIVGNPLPPITPENMKTHLVSGNGYDAALEDQYRNTTKPELGAAIRYSTDGGISAVHGATFLLTTDDGNDIQVFTKNGISNTSPYQLDKQSEMLQRNNNEYGAAIGRTDYNVKSNFGDSNIKKTDTGPYYIHQ